MIPFLDIQTAKNVQDWLNGNYDEATKAEIRRLLDENPQEIVDAFYKHLEFGTGGLRGIMGVGTNRMNQYTVAQATQGLVNYLLKNFGSLPQIKVAIAYDSRNNSKEFAQITAQVFAANNIKVFLFDNLRPTPELSFTIRHLGCQSGVVVTASHNPKEYNGYKAYWNDGAQLVSPHDENVIAEVEKISGLKDVKTSGNEHLIEIIGEDIDKIYLEKVKALSLSPELIKKYANLNIVYTPLHGTGAVLVPRVLSELGFQKITSVAEQSVPDGNFSTVVSPNPEEKAALEMALQKAKEIGADLVMATDPDADRVGVAVKTQNNDYILLNGNQTASVLIYYILKKWKENNRLTGKEYIVKTIVTSELLKAIAELNNVPCYDVLTGFKFIAEIIKEHEGKQTFIAGGEESYGYLIGDFVRDKDAVSACCMIAEIAAWAANQGKTFYDILIEIYEKHGLFKESLLSITRKGKTGAEEIVQMMQNYRSTPPKEINKSKVICIKDYKLQRTYDLITGKEEEIQLPKSDVLQFFTEDGSKVTIRPSGTEPKIKFYFGVKISLADKNDYTKQNQLLDEKIQAIIKFLEVQ